MPSSTDRAVTEHRARWTAPTLVARAPGRVNLIGEHTDYNDGFALPMALPFDTVVAASDHGDPHDGPVRVVSERFGEIELVPGRPNPDLPPWALHIAGVVDLLRATGVPTGGWRASIATDIPTGASLSSSAALEVAMITLLLRRGELRWAPIEVARLGQRVENEVVGLPSGIMDQFISAGATAGHASLMDCRSLTLTPIPIPRSVVVAVMDTGTRRVLAEVAYADRRAACERAAANLGLGALRDATMADLGRIADPVDRRRAHHVLTENVRTLATADALARGDAAEAGHLMDLSHDSLRDEYEVSGGGLDAVVDVARHAPGCYGARMTGGGFAGCAVALVAADRADDFRRHVLDHYSFDGHHSRVWICTPAAGASLIAAP